MTWYASQRHTADTPSLIHADMEVRDTTFSRKTAPSASSAARAVCLSRLLYQEILPSTPRAHRWPSTHADTTLLQSTNYWKNAKQQGLPFTMDPRVLYRGEHQSSCPTSTMREDVC